MSIIFLVGLIIGAGGMLWKIRIGHQELYKFFTDIEQKYLRIETIDQILNQEYFDQAKLLSGRADMIEEATKAYVDGLWDPYTSYLDSETFSGLQQELEWAGQIEGIGAVVSKKDYYIQVDEIIKWSPAFYAWIQPLDRIILIWTGETKELSTFEAVSKIRGTKGSEVELFIERVDKSWEKSYLTLKVVRDIIDIPSVQGTLLTGAWHRIGHLEVSIFGDQTNKLMNQAITHFLDEKVEGIILDLRGNWGGLLTSAVDLAWHFLEPNSLVVQTKYRNYEDISYYSKGFWELSHIPMVILINELSASASEILALALRENRKILILGERSFGKGSIQTLSDFDNATSLKYTIGKWFGPEGTSIDEVGIVPDIEVIFDGTGYIEHHIDNQLQEANTLLIKQLNS